MSETDFESSLPVEPTKAERRRAVKIAAITGIVIALALALGSVRVLGVRSAHAEALQKSIGVQQQVFVNFTFPKPAGSDGAGQVVLPGTLIGGRETAVYARTSGYVKRWLRDIGDHVRKGEAIAEIETPELDKQIAQARATARQAAANLDLAKQSATRWEMLRKNDLVTEQELAERRSAVDQSTAGLNAAQAEVSRLETLASFERVEAPFDGVVTRRSVEVGNLVNAGNGGTGQALFTVDTTDPLRLEIYVPQAYAAKVKTGMPIDVTQAELPGQHFSGKVARTAGAIDSTTRTLQVEVVIPNKDGQLLPGAFVQAGLKLAGAGVLTVPANTLLFRAEGPRIGVVDDHGHVHLAAIALGRDLGKTLEIAGGLQPTDHVVLNPPDSLAEGDEVNATPEQPAGSTPASPDGKPAAAADKPAAGARPAASGDKAK